MLLAKRVHYQLGRESDALAAKQRSGANPATGQNFFQASATLALLARLVAINVSSATLCSPRAQVVNGVT